MECLTEVEGQTYQDNRVLFLLEWVGLEAWTMVEICLSYKDVDVEVEVWVDSVDGNVSEVVVVVVAAI